MHLRLIEVFLPAEERNRFQETLKDHEILGSWQEGSSEGKILAKLLLPTQKSGEVLDLLEKHFTTVKGFRIVLLPVEASIPREQAEDERVEEAEPAESHPCEDKQKLSNAPSNNGTAESGRTEASRVDSPDPSHPLLDLIPILSMEIQEMTKELLN